MTAQIAERLRYEGQELSMCTNPLNDYFAMGGKNPGFQFKCTALWRGYVGSCEFVDGRLYLIGGAHFLTVWKDVEEPAENAMNQRANNPAWLAKQAD